MIAPQAQRAPGPAAAAAAAADADAADAASDFATYNLNILLQLSL
jgi:hypothetical protein